MTCGSCSPACVFSSLPSWWRVALLVGFVLCLMLDHPLLLFDGVCVQLTVVSWWQELPSPPSWCMLPWRRALLRWRTPWRSIVRTWLPRAVGTTLLRRHRSLRLRSLVWRPRKRLWPFIELLHVPSTIGLLHAPAPRLLCGLMLWRTSTSLLRIHGPVRFPPRVARPAARHPWWRR